MFIRMIKRHVKQSGDSFSEVARKVGVSKATVAHWVNGDREPSKLSVRKVCRGLGWDEETEAKLLDITERLSEKPMVFKRNTLTDEFWQLVWELELVYPEGLRGVPDEDERLMRVREIVGGKTNKRPTIYDKRKVEELRLERGYSGRYMSELMGYAQSWYNGTFRKSEKFTLVHARKLAEIFEVDLDVLIKEDV